MAMFRGSAGAPPRRASPARDRVGISSHPCSGSGEPFPAGSMRRSAPHILTAAKARCSPFAAKGSPADPARALRARSASLREPPAARSVPVQPDTPPSTIGSEGTLMGSAVRGTIWQGLAFLLGRASTLLATVVLARLLDPQEFGLVALALVFILFAE